MSSHTEVEGGAAEGSRLDASAHTFPVGSKCCACSSPGIGLLHIQATVSGLAVLKSLQPKTRIVTQQWHAHRTHSVCFVLFIQGS